MWDVPTENFNGLPLKLSFRGKKDATISEGRDLNLRVKEKKICSRVSIHVSSLFYPEFFGGIC